MGNQTAAIRAAIAFYISPLTERHWRHVHASASCAPLPRAWRKTAPSRSPQQAALAHVAFKQCCNIFSLCMWQHVIYYICQDIVKSSQELQLAIAFISEWSSMSSKNFPEPRVTSSSPQTQRSVRLLSHMTKKKQQTLPWNPPVFATLHWLSK